MTLNWQKYRIEGLQSYPMQKGCQVLYADWECAKGLCNKAWKAIYQYVFALSHDVDDLFYYDSR